MYQLGPEVQDGNGNIIWSRTPFSSYADWMARGATYTPPAQKAAPAPAPAPAPTALSSLLGDLPPWQSAGYASPADWLKAVGAGQTSVIQPIANDSGNAVNGFAGGPVEGYASYTPRADGKYVENGAQYENFDASGNSLGMRGFTDDGTKETLGAFLALTGAGMAFLPGGALAGGAAGTAGGLGSAAGDAGLMYAGADAAAAASLGGGASVMGGSALGAAELAALGGGTAGLGAGALGSAAGDAGLMYAGADAASAATLGGGASVNGGMALGAGTAGALTPGVTPPNPFHPASYLNAGNLANIGTAALGGNLAGVTPLLGAATTLLGAAGGAGGGGGSGGSGGGSGGFLDPRMVPALYDTPNGLIPQTQGLLARTGGDAFNRGESVANTGAGLLGRPVAGNGVGSVTMDGYQENPHAKAILDDLQRRKSQLIAEQLNGTRGNFVGANGLGGSRQGVAEGLAIARGADDFAGTGAQFMGNIYENDRNRALGKYTADQGFFGQQRGQDLSQVGMGAGLLQQGQDLQWGPLQQAKGVLAPFSGLNSSAGTDSGSKWGSVLGGALQGAALAGKAGWW